jgi:Alpha/beta hydrolase domain
LCQKGTFCPKIIQTVSSTEYWQGRMSLNMTDALGRQDTAVPDHVRIYLFSSTQHSPATVPTPGLCQQFNNPNAYHDSLRALLVALERWVVAGTLPPPSHYPLIRDGTLVPPDQESIGWSNIPGVKYSGRVNTLYVAAVRATASTLVSQGFLLPEDAARLVSEAEASDVLR